jgi:hypothetical protein
MPPEPRYLTLREVADELVVSRDAVHSWITVGLLMEGQRVYLQAIRAGIAWRVRPEDLRAFLRTLNGRDVPLIGDLEREQELNREASARLDRRLGKPKE